MSHELDPCRNTLKNDFYVIQMETAYPEKNTNFMIIK